MSQKNETAVKSARKTQKTNVEIPAHLLIEYREMARIFREMVVNVGHTQVLDYLVRVQWANIEVIKTQDLPELAAEIIYDDSIFQGELIKMLSHGKDQMEKIRDMEKEANIVELDQMKAEYGRR